MGVDGMAAGKTHLLLRTRDCSLPEEANERLKMPETQMPCLSKD